jgi:ferritin
MSDAVNQAIEAQIGHEFGASQTYLSMAGWFECESLRGFASWMREQSQEEIAHAMKLFDFLVDRGVAPKLPALPAPAHGFEGSLEVFEAAFAHEKKVTGQIHDIYELALAEKDYQAQVLLQWFISEQLEEESLTGGLVDRLRMVEGSRAALLILDSELGSRQGEPHAH